MLKLSINNLIERTHIILIIRTLLLILLLLQLLMKVQ